MKRSCECGRPIHLVVPGRTRGHGIEHPKDHILCRQCYFVQRDQIIAARMSCKPWWAVRSTLRVMQQATTTNTLERTCA